MADFRFEVGTDVLCNLGPNGWKLGRIIALNYREDHWPAGQVAPYQVSLEDDHALIYVPEDDDRYCRKATDEDVRIARRKDALAELPPGVAGSERGRSDSPLACADDALAVGSRTYRSGRCECCDCCPTNWSAVELYSEHYRCAARNGLKVTRHSIDLGTLRVGDAVDVESGEHIGERLPQAGFMQCPTLVRLPPGLRFYDDGSLRGDVRFDPHRGAAYGVEFVAVSTAHWDGSVGLVRLEITFSVQGNEPPDGFDVAAFNATQKEASAAAARIVHTLGDLWEQWEREALDNRETCEQMGAALARLRELLEANPRLDGGRWWARLGGYHMNVHKLLENKLFECELYLGHALTFDSAVTRSWAEQNLKGCYDKRRLEAARFMWIDGLEQMMRGEWARAAETLRLAAEKKDGWGWAVNFGDIWFSECAARLVHGAELSAAGSKDGATWMADAERALDRGVERTAEAGAFGPAGHPWGAELRAAFASYAGACANDESKAWLEGLKARTVYWCAQVLGGAFPFPPKPRPRVDDAAELVQRMPGHNRLAG
ncbi:MAG: hypothetical protein AAF411_30155 [Myxococcota bacterium]